MIIQFIPFINPVVAGKLETWKNYVKEMKGPRNKELKESRKKLGLTIERVWLQNTPMGEYAVVYWEAKDISKVFEGFMKSDAPFDTWFKEKILMEVHGMDFSKPLPPMNELILDFKA